MDNVVSLNEFRQKREREKQAEQDGGPCGCGTFMEPFTFHSDLHQGSETYFFCPTCFNFRINYEVT